MPVYTVHEPRKLTGNPVRDAERFTFVRDGFHFWAFLLGPVWMLFRRMWLVFVLYAIVMAAIVLARGWVKWRWRFSYLDVQRIWRLFAVLSMALIVVSIGSEGASGIYIFFKWLKHIGMLKQ